MEPILHVIVEIQGQMHLTELFGCFSWGLPNLVTWERQGCSNALYQPGAMLSSNAQHLTQCTRTSKCDWSGRSTEREQQQSQTETAPRASSWMAGQDERLLVESPCPYMNVDPSSSWPEALGLSQTWPWVTSCSNTCSQASYPTCLLVWLDVCWRWHTGIRTHTIPVYSIFCSCWHAGYMGPWSLWLLVQLPPLRPLAHSDLSSCCHCRHLGPWGLWFHPGDWCLCLRAHICTQNREPLTQETSQRWNSRWKQDMLWWSGQTSVCQYFFWLAWEYVISGVSQV